MPTGCTEAIEYLLLPDASNSYSRLILHLTAHFYLLFQKQDTPLPV